METVRSVDNRMQATRRRAGLTFDNIKFRKKLRVASEELVARHKYRWFLTLTFKNQDISENAARAALEMLVNIVNGRIYGQARYKGMRMKLVAALEKNSSDGFHFHLLISRRTSPGKLEFHDLLPQYLINIWKSRIDVAGTNNHWTKFEDRHISYITKELPKKDDCLIVDWL